MSTQAQSGSSLQSHIYSSKQLFDVQTECKEDVCRIKLFEIELFDHLTVCKQMTDVYLNW